MEVDKEVKLEDFYRNSVEWSQDYIEFQTTEWYESNVETEGNKTGFENKEYLLKIFGVTEEGYSVCCNVTDYTPFFYIKVPDNWDKNKVKIFLSNLFDTQGNYNGKSYYPLKYLRRYLVQDKCILQKKKDFYGFSGEKLFKFLRLTFRNSDAMKKCINLMKSHNNKKNPTRVNGISFDFKLYESNVDNFMRIIHIRNLKPTGWILAENITVQVEKTTSCQIEISTKWTELHDLDKVNNAPLLQASFDIETYSHDGNFPSPTRPQDCVFQIATAFKYVGEKDFYFKHLLALKACSPIEPKEGEPPIILEVFEKEKDLLLAWSKLIKNTDPDILLAFNNQQFDDNYLVTRAKMLGVEDEFFELTRINDVPATLDEDTFSSSAYGDNKYLRLNIPGRVNFDILIYIKREYKKVSYKLDSLAEEYLGENKNPVTPQMMFDAFAKGEGDELAEVGRYCFPTGTRVSLRNKTIDIKCLENIKTSVASYYENENGFSFSKKNKFFNNGKAECIKLTMNDSRIIECTKDHKFLTNNGWIEAENLTEKDKVVCFPEQAYVDYENEKNEKFTFSEEIGELEYDKASILARILGYLITDGCIHSYNSKNKIKENYVNYRTMIYLQTVFDAKNIVEDVYILTNKRVKFNKTDTTFNISLSSEWSRKITTIKGILVGKKMRQKNFLPDFIKDDNCPLWIKREFIKGLFGGDGCCPSPRGDRPTGLFFVQSKNKEYIKYLQEDMEVLQKIFLKFNIETIIRKPEKNRDGDGWLIDLGVRISSTVNFYEKIGFAYCIGKTYKLSVIASYIKLRSKVYDQYSNSCLKIQKLVNDGIKRSEAIKITHNDLKSKEFIFNEYYSLPDSQMSRNYCRPRKTSETSFRKDKFLGIIEFLKEIKAYHWWDKDYKGQASYAIKKDCEFTPCYYLKVLHKENVGIKEVYDIEVKNTHNFVVNGLTVHNCIQDTLLPQKLCDTLYILQNQISMSNVTYTSIKWLLEKGQSIKVFSQILRETRKKNFLVPVMDYDQMDMKKFEGATVLPPATGAYFTPVTVCDFASLYPSIIRAHNLCYSTIVLNPEYDNLKGIEYESFTWEDNKDPNEPKTLSYRYVQNIPGILPDILAELALARKKYKKLMAAAETKDLKEIHNKNQLAVKVSMNSIYGFLAAKKIHCKPIAATTTAIGRRMIESTKNFMETNYKDAICRAGDTDSVFISFMTPSIHLYNSERKRVYSKGNGISSEDREILKKLKSKCIQESIDIGTEAANAATKALFKFPISLEYEKVYSPVFLLTKKRYLGELYETNPDKMSKFDNKGVVLKRRDNFNLLKTSYKDIIDILFKDGEYGIPQVKDYLNWTFREILDGSIDLKDLVVTKSLRGDYKAQNIPHVVLAQKIAKRDPGNAYRSNDRVPYVFVDTGETKKVPMYMKVEDPEYVRQNNLKLDVEYYINFLKNPICEILELFIKNPQELFENEIDKYKRKRSITMSKESKIEFMKKFKK